MIRVYFGSQGAGRSEKAMKDLSPIKSDSFAVYATTTGILRDWKAVNPAILEIIMPATEGLILLNQNVIVLDDRSSMMFSCLADIDLSKDICFVLESYDSSMYNIFKAAEEIYYFAGSPGALSDIPDEFKPSGEIIRKINALNTSFGDNKYYVFKKG